MGTYIVFLNNFTILFFLPAQDPPLPTARAHITVQKEILSGVRGGYLQGFNGFTSSQGHATVKETQVTAGDRPGTWQLYEQVTIATAEVRLCIDIVSNSAYSNKSR